MTGEDDVWPRRATSGRLQNLWWRQGSFHTLPAAELEWFILELLIHHLNVHKTLEQLEQMALVHYGPIHTSALTIDTRLKIVQKDPENQDFRSNKAEPWKLEDLMDVLVSCFGQTTRGSGRFRV